VEGLDYRDKLAYEEVKYQQELAGLLEALEKNFRV
jgi:plasmid replication initiation protein